MQSRITKMNYKQNRAKHNNVVRKSPPLKFQNSMKLPKQFLNANVSSRILTPRQERMKNNFQSKYNAAKEFQEFDNQIKMMKLL